MFLKKIYIYIYLFLFFLAVALCLPLRGGGGGAAGAALHVCSVPSYIYIGGGAATFSCFGSGFPQAVVPLAFLDCPCLKHACGEAALVISLTRALQHGKRAQPCLGPAAAPTNELRNLFG